MFPEHYAIYAMYEKQAEILKFAERERLARQASQARSATRAPRFSIAAFLRNGTALLRELGQPAQAGASLRIEIGCPDERLTGAADRRAPA